MARRKQMTVGSKYVAIGALSEVLSVIFDVHPDLESPVELAEETARMLVERVWDVEHFPVANKVTITFDLSALDKPADGPQTAD